MGGELICHFIVDQSLITAKQKEIDQVTLNYSHLMSYISIQNTETEPR
jgi:hypothetical protein